MKNILFASTALVAFGGAAVADVALSGRAEMGIFNADSVSSAGAFTSGSTQFFTDIDVTFTMSGETDNGLTFGASVDLDEGGSGAAAVANNADDGGATIFISGGFGTVTMGDTDGALDWALTEAGNVGNPGSIADDETSHAGYLGSYLDGAQDGQILRYDNTFGAFGVAVSIDDDNGVAAASPGYAIGLKYTLDLSGTAVNLGFGYQKSDLTNATYAYNNFAKDAGSNAADLIAAGAAEMSVIGLSADATFANGLSAGIVYTMHDIDNAAGVKIADVDHIGVGLGYTTGAFSVHANYGQYKVKANGFKSSGIGLSAAYDLGGGAVIHAGYGKGNVTGVVNDLTTMSLGLGLSF